MSSRSTRSDLLFSAVILVFTKLRSFAVLPLVYRSMGAEAYGVWSLTLGFVGILAALAHLQSHSLLNRSYRSLTGEARRVMVWTIMTIGSVGGIVVGAALTLGSDRLARLVGAPEAGALLAAGGVLVTTHVLADLATNYLRAGDGYRAFVVLDAVPAFAEVAAIGYVVATHSSLLQALGALVLTDVLIVVGCALTLLRRDPPAPPTRAAARTVFAYVLPLVPSGVGDWLLNQGDRMIISSYLGPDAVGVYSAAYALGALPLFLMRPLQVVLLGHLAPLWDQGQRARVEGTLSLALKVYLAMAIPAAVGIGLAGPIVLARVTGGADARWTPSLLATIGLGTTMLGGLMITTHGLLLLQRTGTTATIWLGGALVNMVGNLLLVPRYGLAAAGWMTLVSYASSLVASIVWFRRELRMTVSFTALFKITAATVTMAAVFGEMRTTSLPRLALAIGVAAVTYAVMLVATSTFDADERRQILRRRGG